jgi:hypothetical protein
MLGLPLLLALTLAQNQPPAPDLQIPRVLTVTYSDGRVVPRILTPRGASWSPFFPHRTDAPMRDGLAVTGLKVEHRIEADAVVVTVSLAYGQPAQSTVQVTTIRLHDRESISVPELTNFGVDPITIALDLAPPAAVVIPTVNSVSPMVDVEVDLASQDQPLYTVTFHNRSTTAISAIAYRAYRGETPRLSGTRKANRGLQVLEPGGRLQFTTQAASNGAAQGFDRFEVTAVFWADGTVEGDATLKSNQQSLALGEANQLRRVIALLREHKAGSVAEVVAAAEKLRVKVSSDEVTALGASGHEINISYFESGQSYVRTAVLDDLKAYVQSRSGNASAPAGAWIQEAAPRYSSWLGRIAPR